jgi:iron complex transport system permease protein
MYRSTIKAALPFLLLSATLLVIAPFIGPFDAWDRFALPDEGKIVVFQLRLPRAILGFAVGGILATSGLVCQSLVRNPLATPTTLGVSSGAALGASLVILWGSSFQPFSAPFVGAVCGAAVTSVLLFSLYSVASRGSSAQIVLIGILVNYFIASVILFIQCVADPAALSRIVIWLIGAVPSLSWRYTITIASLALGCLVLITLRAPQLQVLALGRDAAESRGVAVGSLERSLLLTTSVGIGAAVASCGSIGFVGILEPQICRRFVGSDYRILIPSVFLLGGSVVLCADLLGRIIFAPFEVPAGVLTALVEIPVGLFLLIKRR